VNKFQEKRLKIIFITIKLFLKNMENFPAEKIKNELSPADLGFRFNAMDNADFIYYLRRLSKENPSFRFSIVAEWMDVGKARFAKALADEYSSRFNIDSITIRATRQQYEEDVNTFASGVKWEEIE
jgi:hypothetical protein